MTAQAPAAFMSYVRSDDRHEEGRLTQFRERLSGEVQIQTGEDFPIFQDRNDIKWGQAWEERIEQSLDEVTFLIPIVTPSFLRSPACRNELQRFLDREKQLGRNDLILPVYYVDSPLLNDEARRNSDELAQILAGRQYADWRDLRFEPFSSPDVGKMLARLAVQVRDALDRVPTTAKAAAGSGTTRTRTRRGSRRPGVSRPSAREKAAESTASETESAIGQIGVPSGPASKSEPPTLVVDPMYRGDHLTITEAIDAAQPGDRILVRPGLYQEGIVIDKPLELISEGDLGEIVIQASGENAVLFKASMGRIANLTLRQIGGDDWDCVTIAQGRLEMDECDITSQSLACVAIHGGADPRLRRNRIHDGGQLGVYVFDNGQGTLEDNEIFGNGSSGIQISEGANPTLRRNRIHDSKESGVFVYENGQGTLEDNEIFGNGVSGVQISEGANPTLRRNRIHDSKKSGVFVYNNGEGILEDNEIFGNALVGVHIKEGGSPTLRRNHVHQNAYEGVWIDEHGGGTFEDNDLRNNDQGAWNISSDSNPNVTRSGNLE